MMSNTPQQPHKLSHANQNDSQHRQILTSKCCTMENPCRPGMDHCGTCCSSTCFTFRSKAFVIAVKTQQQIQINTFLTMAAHQAPNWVVPADRNHAKHLLGNLHGAKTRAQEMNIPCKENHHHPDHETCHLVKTEQRSCF